MTATLERHGTPGGPLVIALHGAVANRKTWLPLARVLPVELELWAPDLPGHGTRRDEPFTLDAALDTVDALVALARPRRAILAGDSLGGYLALAAAARLQRGLAGVVAGGCSWSMDGLAGAVARLSDGPVRLLERVLGTARLETLAARLLAGVTDGATASEIVAAGLRLEARSESLRALAGTNVFALASRIRVPLVVVNGAWDWPTRAGERALVRAVREGTLRIEPRAGHGVALLAPRAFALAVATLVGRERSFVRDARPPA